MRVAFTVDVEDWYHTSDLNLSVHTWSKYERRVDANTHRLLDLLDEYQGKATFFVLGCVANEYPSLIREIVLRGHELACHGYGHQMLTRMRVNDIWADIYKAKTLLEDISGVCVSSYRAPSWSLQSETSFVLPMLEELGFSVDSSLQPFRTPLSGATKSPLAPFYPIVDGRVLSILEIPSVVNNVLSVRYPFSGGLYFRMWPMRFIKWSFAQVGKQRLAMAYVHPWELDPEQPDIAPSPLIRFTHYYNLGKTETKLRSFLEEFPAFPIRDLIAGESFPQIHIFKSGRLK